jgi:hypothetical protein
MKGTAMDAQEALDETLTYYGINGMVANEEGTAMIALSEAILDTLAAFGFEVVKK